MYAFYMHHTPSHHAVPRPRSHATASSPPAIAPPGRKCCRWHPANLGAPPPNEDTLRIPFTCAGKGSSGAAGTAWALTIGLRRRRRRGGAGRGGCSGVRVFRHPVARGERRGGPNRKNARPGMHITRKASFTNATLCQRPKPLKQGRISVGLGSRP
jgi:hypothetical protein